MIFYCYFLELSKQDANKSFGRPALSTIKSFVSFKTGKDGRPNKKQLCGKNKKEDDKPDDNEVIINIRLKVLCDGELKEKRGKTLPIKVNKHTCYKELLEQAKSKWRDFHKDLYCEGAEYVLLYEDGQEAVFLPGTSKEFFTLAKYKEAILKDYKRIALYLCTVDDLQESMDDSDVEKEEKESDGASAHALVSKRKSESNASDIATEPPNKQRTTVTNQSTISIDPGPSGSSTCTVSSNSGTDSSWFYYDEIDRLYGMGESPHNPELVEPSSDLVPDCDVDIIKSLKKKS